MFLEIPLQEFGEGTPGEILEEIIQPISEKLPERILGETLKKQNHISRSSFLED